MQHTFNRKTPQFLKHAPRSLNLAQKQIGPIYFVGYHTANKMYKGKSTSWPTSNSSKSDIYKFLQYQVKWSLNITVITNTNTVHQKYLT